MPDRPKAKAKIAVRKVGEETFLFNTAKGKIKILNPTGAFIWRLCNGKHSKEDIIDKLEKKFEIKSKATAEKDLGRLLKELSQDDFVSKI